VRGIPSARERIVRASWTGSAGSWRGHDGADAVEAAVVAACRRIRTEGVPAWSGTTRRIGAETRIGRTSGAACAVNWQLIRVSTCGTLKARSVGALTLVGLIRAVGTREDTRASAPQRVAGNAAAAPVGVLPTALEGCESGGFGILAGTTSSAGREEPVVRGAAADVASGAVDADTASTRADVGRGVVGAPSLIPESVAVCLVAVVVAAEQTEHAVRAGSGDLASRKRAATTISSERQLTEVVAVVGAELGDTASRASTTTRKTDGRVEQTARSARRQTFLTFETVLEDVTITNRADFALRFVRRAGNGGEGADHALHATAGMVR
jgi:hypothetical protein